MGRDFTNWVKDRLESCMFKENEDFVIYANSGEKSQGRGRPAKEYSLSLDVAKHFAMLERNEKGDHTVGTLGGPQKKLFITEAGLYSL